MKKLLPLVLAMAVAPTAFAQDTPTEPAPAPETPTAPAPEAPTAPAPATPEPATPATPAAPAADGEIDPAAKALLSESAAAYKALKGLSMNYTAVDQGGPKTSTLSGMIAFAKPNKAKVVIKDGTQTNLTLSDGKKLYSQVDAKMFQGAAFQGDGVAAVFERIPSAASVFMPALAAGNNPLESGNMGGAIVKSLPDNGVSMTAPTGPGGPSIVFNLYVDPTDKLVRRIEAKIDFQGKSSSNITTFTEVKANPAFAASEFTFTAGPGVKVVAEVPTFDSRIKVGVAPFALKGKDLSGKGFNWAQYKGKVVLLDFWATWCGPCVGELPNVLKAYKTYHPKGFEIVGVSLDEDKKALTDFIKARSLTYTNLYDGKGWKNVDAATYGVRAIPFTLLIGKDGKIAAVNPRGEALEPALKKALAVKYVAPKAAAPKAATPKAVAPKAVAPKAATKVASAKPTATVIKTAIKN